MKVYRLKETAQLPAYATEGSACFDVRACLQLGERVRTYNPWNKEVKLVVKTIGGKVAFQLPPEHRCLIPTGLIFDIPEGHVLKMYNRSSTALKKGLVLPNSVGIIDSDYIEESFIMLHNISDSLVTINDGDRLAQAMLETLLTDRTVEETSERPVQKTSRNGGFGSTGL